MLKLDRRSLPFNTSICWGVLFKQTDISTQDCEMFLDPDPSRKFAFCNYECGKKVQPDPMNWRFLKKSLIHRKRPWHKNQYVMSSIHYVK